MTPLHHQANPKIIILSGVFLLVALGLFWWSLALVPQVTKNTTNSNRACSQEAKICPDGSAVGRIGPNCEFAACPNSNANSGGTGDCLISGCSRQVCAETEVTTTCEMKEEYACYASAECERQTNGSCGWTMTTGLRDCLIRSALPN